MCPNCWSQEFSTGIRVINLPRDTKVSYLKDQIADLKFAGQPQMTLGEEALSNDYKLLKDAKHAFYLKKNAAIFNFAS